MKDEDFKLNQQFKYGEIWYRVCNGDRCADDMKIQISLDGTHWITPHIAHVLILVAFKFQVEENNYGENGKKQKGQGGWYLFKRIKSACENGWKQAINLTREEALAAAEKRKQNSKQDVLFR